MMQIKDLTIAFNSKADESYDIINELNDLKLILLSIAFKLGENEREQLIKELSDIKSERVQQWISNLKLANDK